MPKLKVVYMSEKIKKENEKTQEKTASAQSNNGASKEISNKTKIPFTKQQANDVQDFKNALEKGDTGIAFSGTLDEGTEHLKGLVHQKGGKVEVHCLGCDGKIDMPDDSRTGELTVCKDCGESYEIDMKNCSLKPAEKVGEDWGE